MRITSSCVAMLSIVCAANAPQPAHAEANPALAGVFSAFIPGAGQMYAGQVGRGIGFLGVETLLFAAVGGSTGFDIALAAPLGSRPGIVPAILGWTLVAVHIWNIRDAVAAAKESSATKPATHLSPLFLRAVSFLGPEDYSRRLHLGFSSARSSLHSTRVRLSYGFFFH